jgi:hypothetical protein
MATKLRLIHDATKTRAVQKPVARAQLTEEEFSRKLLTANHGPACAAFLARKFKRSIRKNGYFVTRLANSEELPMWFSLALRFFEGKSDRWDVREINRTGVRLWKVVYLRHGKFARRRGTHLRVV